MLEGTNQIRRGTVDDALRAARAEVVKWSAVDAGVSDLSLCGLRGSPTIVKSVFAPPARAEKAKQIPATGATPDELAVAVLDEIFAQKPSLEADLRGALAH
jgi:electron transfer flavoprotein beta subunit